MRWPQEGWIKKKHYTLLYIGLKTSKGQHGTGSLITGCATQCILGFEPINTLNAELNPICHLLALLGAHHILHVSSIRVNERMCKLRIKGKFCNITIINVYTPTEDENTRNAEMWKDFIIIVRCV